MQPSSPPNGSTLLIRASLDFLTRFSPFNRMEEEALHFLAERLQLAFYPRGSDIVTPDTGLPSHFHVIERGRIQARQVGALAVTEYATMTLNPGECFPIGALSAQRPPTNAYVALEDSYIYLLPAADFSTLMQMSPAFHLFCTRYIASLLNQSRRQLQNTFTQRAAEQHTMTTALSQLLKDELIHVAPHTPTREALEIMAAHNIGSMVITGPERQPLGILTRSDLLPRIVLPGLDLDEPIHTVMTPDPLTLSASASAYDAVLLMTTHGIQHLVVVDGRERVIGVVSERDLFSLQRISMRQIRASIDSATDLEGLVRASRDIRQLALNLVAQGIAAEQLTQLISALNDALTRHTIAMARTRHDLETADITWLALGSEGRHEQTLSPDQDNGLIYTCPPDEDETAFKNRLLAFARDVNEQLALCDFPLCKSNLMASNPELCLTPEQWRERFAAWMEESNPEALLEASIFFDFRVLAGNEGHGEQLREWLTEQTSNNDAFLRAMARNAIQVKPPLGRFRDFVLEDDATVDLKKSGARLFVDAARVFALRAGVESGNTARRLREAAHRLGFRKEDVAAIIDGFHFIQLLRLRSQHLENEQGAAGDNRIKPGELNELDRRILKEAFRQARKLQLRLKLDYQL